MSDKADISGSQPGTIDELLALLQSKYPDLELTRQPARSGDQPLKLRWHVIAWLSGSALAALVPIFFKLLHAFDVRLKDPTKPIPDLFELLGSGELLLISIVLALAGLSEIMFIRHQIHKPKILGGLSAAAILLLLGSGYWYADLDGLGLTVPGSANEVVTYGSTGIFLLVSLVSSGFILLARSAE